MDLLLPQGLLLCSVGWNLWQRGTSGVSLWQCSNKYTTFFHHCYGGFHSNNTPVLFLTYPFRSLFLLYASFLLGKSVHIERATYPGFFGGVSTSTNIDNNPFEKTNFLPGHSKVEVDFKNIELFGDKIDPLCIIRVCQKSHNWYMKNRYLLDPQLTPYGPKTNPIMGPVNLYMELYNQKSNSIKW